ncbi:MAG: DNA polymerase III subunit delta [bacterium]|nr:MAG: DNA polymerase III subunit delta [bacterium]
MIYYNQALRDIQNSKIEPFYLFFGEEQLLAENLIKKIKSVFLTELEPELNYFVRYASENGADEVIALSSGMGLFSKRKLLILKEADSLKQKELDRLSRLFENPPPDIVLILQTSISSLYQTRLKKIENIITVVHILPLKTEELKIFILEEFQKNGKRITDEAIEMLIFMVGNQLSDLSVQIGHINDYFGKETVYDVKHVETVAGVYATQDVYELSRLISMEEYRKAAAVLSNLTGSGMSPQFILNQLLRHFTALWRIQGYLRAGITRTDVLSSHLKMYYKYVDEYKTQLKNWKPSRLMGVIQSLKKVDRELKNNTLEPQIILDMLNYQIINIK